MSKTDKVVTSTCAGCMREFTVIQFDEGAKPLYCTQQCKDNHSIFKKT